MLFVIGIVVLVISAPGSILSNLAQDQSGIVDLYWAASAMVCYVFITGPIEYGGSYVMLKAVRDGEFGVGDVFQGYRDYFNVVTANVLVAIIIGLGLALLIVPGIIFACKLAFVPYLVLDKKMSAWDAVQESWDMTTGHAWKVFAMALLTVPIFIAGLICLGVGVLVSIMFIGLAFASLYHMLDVADESLGTAV